MEDLISKYQKYIERAVSDYVFPQEPQTLYDPLRYFMQIGGKRMRPILALMACEMFSADFKKAKNAAIAVELFHNFSLIHDDIMDAAPLRRGKTTVHEKWNTNVAILSGDALLIEAYKAIANHDSKVVGEILPLFNKTATEVCEGQQLDIDFEEKSIISVADYINMIAFKTAVLLGCSLKMGAIVGGANNNDAQDLYDFGLNLGIAFQIQDDILDVYADQDKFGKQVGGDIISNKKTYLLLTALNESNPEQYTRLEQLLLEKDLKIKVAGVKAIYEELNIREKANRKMEEYHEKAMQNLSRIAVTAEHKRPLKSLAGFLLGRDH